MTDAERISLDLERHIIDTQKRFEKAMKRRLVHMDIASKERYFAVLSSLVTKLEDPDKPLRAVLQEVVIESAPYIAQELSGK